MTEARDEELVIIRRRSAFAEADYKSGVWKIAYADFMTAMMAFFLVMWLINATNQETRESVASYFNPVKLAEMTPDSKGLNDPKKKETGKPSDEDKAAPPPEPAPAPEPEPPPPPAPKPGAARPADTPLAARMPRYDESALFRDPYAILTDIAGGPASSARRERRIGITLGSPDRHAASGGEAHRDPFDPIYWQVAPQASIEQLRSGDRGSLPVDADLAALGDNEPRRPSAGKLDVTKAPPGRIARAGTQLSQPEIDPHPETSDSAAAIIDVQSASPMPGSLAAGLHQRSAKANSVPNDQDSPANPAAERDAQMKQPDQAPAKTGDTKPTTRDESAARLQASIQAALEAAPKPGPVADVQLTDEGLLLSLTDSAHFGMFAIGSAEPQRELVRTIDKIAPLLSDHRGSIIVRGHTDARPFRSQNYDNWRLSTARAHMAFHMLVRGGVDPSRIERIEGHADRRPKIASDPLAAPNRRIEILIKERRL